jgi:hypothetical protein
MKESEEMSDYDEMLLLLYGESSDQNKQLIALAAIDELGLPKVNMLSELRYIELVQQSIERNFELMELYSLYDRGNGSDVEEEKRKSRNMNMSWTKQRRSNTDWQQGPPRTSIRPKCRVKSSIQNRKNKMRR